MKKIILIVSLAIIIIAAIGCSVFDKKYMFFQGRICSKDVTEIRIWENKDLDKIRKFTNLKKVVVGPSADLRLDSLDFLEACDLESLVIMHQTMDDWSSLGKLTSLKELIFLTSNFNDINDIKQMVSLETLIIDDSELESTEGIGDLKNLKYLSLYSNKITDIGAVISLDNIEELELGKNPFSSINGIDNPGKLKVLGISNTNIEEYDVLLNMRSLENLRVSENSLPNDIKDKLAEKNVKIIITDTNSKEQPV